MGPKAKKAAEAGTGQQFLPGHAPKVNKKLDEAGRNYAKLVKDRMAIQAEEKSAENVLITLMEKLDIAEYSAGGVTIVLNTTKKPKVKVIDPDAEAAAKRNGDTDAKRETGKDDKEPE